MCAGFHQMGSTVNATDFTVSSSTVQWTAPAVTVTDTTAYVYVPDYITTGALMAPYVRLAIGSVTTNHVLPQLPLYEGPVVTGESSGSHFGDCTGTCVNTDHIVTVVGRNFAPDVTPRLTPSPPALVPALGGATLGVSRILRFP